MSEHDDATANIPLFPINSDEYIAETAPRKPAPEVSFSFTSAGAPDGGWRVTSAHVREMLSDLYAAPLELVTEDPLLSADMLLGEHCALSMTRGPRMRRVCGLARRIERSGHRGGHRLVRVEIVPALWVLSQRSTSRIFQGSNAPDIVRAVLRDAGLYAKTLAVELSRHYPVREYCVQYRETDLAFVMRLLESEGVAFYFRHEGASEVLVLADSPSYRLCPTLDRRAVPFAAARSELAPVETVRDLAWRRELRPTGVTVRDFDFTRPSAEQDLTRAFPRGADGPGPRALYDYPGRYTIGDYGDDSRRYAAHDGARQAELRYLAARATADLAGGESDVTGFTPGMAFELVGHDQADLDQRYLVTHVEHFVSAPEETLATASGSAGASASPRYRNLFECVPATVPFVPAAVTPSPTVLGTQTATVVGPPGEEIHVDSHGRIKVQFHWDLLGQKNAMSSAFVRVAQAWAGVGFGVAFTPRVGMEVVVQFLEGNPDRPLVTGCVYNGENPLPVSLPSEKTRSILKTHSSPGGDGYNELSFEDMKGAEEIRLHAERDLRETVGNAHELGVGGSQSESVGGARKRFVGLDERLEVVGNRHVTVGMKHTRQIGGDEQLTVGGDQHQAVIGSRARTVGGAETTTVATDHALTIGGEYALHSTGAARIGSATELTAGGGAKVTLQAGPPKGGHSAIEMSAGDIHASCPGWIFLSTKRGMSGTGITIHPDSVGLFGFGGVFLSACNTFVIVETKSIKLEIGDSKLVLTPSSITLTTKKLVLEGDTIDLVTTGGVATSAVHIDGKPFGKHMHPCAPPGSPSGPVIP